MFTKHGERSRIVGSQAGFTLLELLVVIAIMGALGGVAVFGVSKFRATAQKTALDQSLHTVATAVEAQILLENLTDLSEIRPADLAVRGADGIDFVAFDLTPTSAVVQARFADTLDPCRQIHYPNTTPGPCDSTAGKTLRSFTPGRSEDPGQIAMMSSLTKRDEDDAKRLEQRNGQLGADDGARKNGAELTPGRRLDTDMTQKDLETRKKETSGRMTMLEDDIKKMENDLATYQKHNQSKIDDLNKRLEAETAKGRDASRDDIDELTAELRKLETPIDEYRKDLDNAHAELDRLRASLDGGSDGKQKADK